jgi:hypothetical protein
MHEAVGENMRSSRTKKKKLNNARKSYPDSILERLKHPHAHFREGTSPRMMPNQSFETQLARICFLQNEMHQSIAMRVGFGPRIMLEFPLSFLPAPFDLPWAKAEEET